MSDVTGKLILDFVRKNTKKELAAKLVEQITLNEQLIRKIAELRDLRVEEDAILIASKAEIAALKTALQNDSKKFDEAGRRLTEIRQALQLAASVEFPAKESFLNSNSNSYGNTEVIGPNKELLFLEHLYKISIGGAYV